MICLLNQLWRRPKSEVVGIFIRSCGRKIIRTISSSKHYSSFDEITGVGHRVVAGGELFKDSALVDDTGLSNKFKAEFATIGYQQAEVVGMRAFKHILPDITSKRCIRYYPHTTMPKKAYLYSIPMEYYKNSKLVNTELTVQATATFSLFVLLNY